MSYLATKQTPPDLAAAGFPWRITTAESWTDAEFRAPIIAFLREFQRTPGRNWVARIEDVTEHILSGANMNKPLPRTPRWPADVPDPVRVGLASLVFRVRNRLTGSVYEYGIPFVDRLESDPAQTRDWLQTMGDTFDARARASE
jgi:hypothetical protein